MRKLLYFPIIHDQADMGSLETKISQEGERKYGQAAWKDHLKQVQISWNRLQNKIKQQFDDVPADKVKIYQDGLPEAGEIGLKIIKEVAKRGSKNYQIVEDLLRKGAQLEKAESKELLIQEYNYLSRLRDATTPVEQLNALLVYQEKAQELLNKRDDYIANRINITLKYDELGIAFFGSKHSIIDRLNKDITVTRIQEFKDKITIDLINQGL
ncbi:MAG: hypothetical protein KKA79_04920 [Nanoarchaeota archaeon]|nr:hypothetical protein [Nanoarchaeota archaeon]